MIFDEKYCSDEVHTLRIGGECVWSILGEYEHRTASITPEILKKNYWFFVIFTIFDILDPIPDLEAIHVRPSNGPISELRRSCGVNRSINIPQKCTTYRSRTPRTLKNHSKTIFASSSFFSPICPRPLGFWVPPGEMLWYGPRTPSDPLRKMSTLVSLAKTRKAWHVCYLLCTNFDDHFFDQKQCFYQKSTIVC